MVTKQRGIITNDILGSVLAKILMVTKLQSCPYPMKCCSVLAKILMVTKQNNKALQAGLRSVLAKILMVTKRIILW